MPLHERGLVWVGCVDVKEVAIDAGKHRPHASKDAFSRLAKDDGARLQALHTKEKPQVHTPQLPLPHQRDLDHIHRATPHFLGHCRVAMEKGPLTI
eukprot:8468096-Prorocentrum_lima.AAC.1